MHGSVRCPRIGFGSPCLHGRRAARPRAFSPLSLQKIEQIRGQLRREDWSAQVCPGATLADLDSQAIAFARQQYKDKNPKLAADVDQWSDETFLNKAKVCISGQVTRTAIILLGRSESEHFLSPAVARITWVLKDAHGAERDYEHFGPPLLLAADAAFHKIRNLTYRYLANATLFPTEVSQYHPWVIREVLHNAIAHQDCTQAGRINLVGEPESVLVTNLGDFLPGSVEEVIRRDAPPEFYRNRFLAEAMVNLNMIDTIGGGIRRTFTTQWERSFPMPDYDLDEPVQVKARIVGKVIDEKYTRMLMQRTDMDLMDVIALDKVLWDKLSDALNGDQKKNRIMNVLQEMRKEGTILNVSEKRGLGARWALHKPASGTGD